MPIDGPVVVDRPGTVDDVQPHVPVAHTRPYQDLKSTHPLLLLPVRLETRFEGTALRIRIYPDQVHLDEHTPALTTGEVTLAKRFWRRYLASDADDARAAAVAWVTEHIPPRRAAWVARTTRPKPGSGGRLQFPNVAIDDTRRQVLAAGLPDRWCAVGYKGGDRRFAVFGREIAADLAVAPSLGDAAPWSSDAGALPVDDAVAWMIDYQEALDAGMAITVDLSGQAFADVRTGGLDTLVVVGVRDALPADGTDALRRLLEAHHYSDGLRFLAQGTPTSNTDEAVAGWSPDVDDVQALFARELEGDGVATDDDSAAVRASRALGLAGSALLGRVESGETTEEASASAMNRALWLVTWGRYFDQLLARRDGESVIPRAAIDAVRDRFIAHVRGGAPLPAIACHAQPYGILPVRRTVPRDSMSDPSQMLEYLLLALREDWRASLPVVPRLDPVLGAEGGAATNEAESDIVTILGTLPHPGRFQLRGLYDQRDLRAGAWQFFMDALNLGGPPFYGVGGWYAWEKDRAHDADSQIELLEDFKEAAASILQGHEDAGDTDVWIDTMIRMVEAHKARMEPLDEYAATYVSGVLDAEVDDPAIAYAGYGSADDTLIWARDLVQAPDAERGATAWDYLAGLRTRIPSGIVAGETKGPVGGTVLDAGTLRRARRSQEMSDRDITARGPSASSGTRTLPRSRTAPGARTLPGSRTIPGTTPLPGTTLPGTTLPGQTTEVPDATEPAPLTAAFHANEPLLYQLIDSVVSVAADLPFQERAEYRAALTTLQDTPPDELELRLRETLGLATHRLDAWITGLAMERLDAMRSTDRGAQGIQLGGFGWVQDLRPDAAGTRASQGFIHAPSMAQASTAAVLRAGWSVHGTGAADSTLAVDLRSDRIRLASWLLDGVRQGQQLGDLLGRRFERRLHDDRIDQYIDDCRRAVLVSKGKTRDPRGPVDGLDLADLYQASGITVEDGATTITPAGAVATEPRRRLRAALDDILAAIDAVSDAGIADSLHHMLQGNTSRSSATLDALSTGDVPPPELHSARTPVAGVGITHRVMLLLGAGNDGASARTAGDAASTWGTSPRSILEPELETCVARWLGDPGAIHCSVRAAGSPMTEAVDVTFADLGVSALDAVFEAPRGDPGGDTRWTRRIEATARAGHPELTGAFTVEFDDHGRGANRVSFREFAMLARSVRALLGRSRPMAARDLALPGGDIPSGWDVTAAQKRLAALRSIFDTALRTLERVLPAPTPEESKREARRPIGDAPLAAVRDAMTGLAGFALPTAIPRSGWSAAPDQRAALYAEAWLLHDRARAIRSAITELERQWARDDSTAAATPDRRVQRMTEVVQLLLGKPFPFLPRLSVADATATDAAFARSGELLGGDPATGTGWLQDVSTVRAGASLLNDVLDLRELVADVSTSEIAVAQLPSIAGEPWVARAAPARDDRGRLALFAYDHGGIDALRGLGEVAGLVVDQWVERIPASDVVTGTALHFDAPSSRPPQTMLLVVPPETESWSFDLVVDALLETLEAASLRAVDPESLQSFGQHLPAIFPRGSLDAGPQPQEGAG